MIQRLKIRLFWTIVRRCRLQPPHSGHFSACATVAATTATAATALATATTAAASAHHTTAALWSGTNKNRDVSTGPLSRPFARSLAPLTHGKVNFWCLNMTWFCPIVHHFINALELNFAGLEPTNCVSNIPPFFIAETRILCLSIIFIFVFKTVLGK